MRLRERRTEDRLPVPLQLQVLEADHLDSWKTEELRDGGFILQGIEFDALGRRRAYWLFPTHLRRAAAGSSRIGCRRTGSCTSSSGCVPGRCAACRGSRR